MRRSISSALWPILAAVLSACASGGTQGASQSAVGNPDVITREEIDQSRGSTNAFELIQSIRPQWLITRGIANLRQAAGEEDIVVYLDNARLGYREALRRLTLGSVRYLEFFDARRATQRWGGGHMHGAILVSTTAR